MANDWLPPDFRYLADWTELVEMCDWDEDKAANAIMSVMTGNTKKMNPDIIKQSKKIIDFVPRQIKTSTIEA